MREDHTQRWEHGRKVFVSPSTSKGSDPARMDLSGTCGSRSLEALYAADRRSIETQTPKAAITSAKLESDAYVLTWRVGDRMHYGKVWKAKDDAGCFVKAVLDYDAREQPTFDAIIAKLSSASPVCR